MRVTACRTHVRYGRNMRLCAQCGRAFRPSSRHLRCPACRSKSQCACGRPKQVRSRTCSRCRKVGGRFNGNWKGGMTRHKAGYIMLKLPEHPRARTMGYVFQHILVMEQMLGRPLLPHETVHHRNGVRDDNRPENLELWTRPQPPGIRAADAVAWAWEVIERYGSQRASNNAQTMKAERSWR